MTDRKLFGGVGPAAALIALAVAGCAGGGGAGADASFISKVDAECRIALTQVDALGQPASDSLIDETAFFRKVLPLLRAHRDKVKAIRPPRDKAADFAAAAANRDATLNVLQQGIAAGDAGDSARLNEIVSQLEALNTAGDALANKLGVTDCVSRSSSGVVGSTSTTTTTTGP